MHRATLRRWADKGAIETTLTPGGHRRFAASEVERLERRRSVSSPNEIGSAWAGMALSHVRSQISNHDQPAWDTLAPADRREYRELGRRLMSVAMHYIADDSSAQSLLEEARVVGEAQATLAIRSGQTLTDALSAAMFFKDALMEMAIQLPAHAQVRPDANARLLRRINTLLNVVQLAIGRVYERRAGYEGRA